MCWNKGNSSFNTKKDEINILINDHSPLLLGILEANIDQDQHLQMVKIDGYTEEIDNLYENGFKSRTLVYINDQSDYLRRRDLEPPNSPVIWLEFPNRGGKPFLVFIGYREWRCIHLKENKKKKTSGNRTEQIKRLDDWNLSWSKAECENKMMILMGDYNIDLQPWFNPKIEMTEYQEYMSPMLEKLKEMCLTNNLEIIQTGHTRIQGKSKAST